MSHFNVTHYNDVIMSVMASQITSLTIVYSCVYLGVDQRKHQSSASLAFVWEIHRWAVNSPHKGPATWEMFPFDDVIMELDNVCWFELDEYWRKCDGLTSNIITPTKRIFLDSQMLSHPYHFGITTRGQLHMKNMSIYNYIKCLSIHIAVHSCHAAVHRARI